jgi:hypothetical protein
VLVSNDQPLLVVKANRMKTKNILIVLLIGGGLALSVLPAQAKEHDEGNISAENVPLTVTNAAESAVQGAKILRWEKEGDNYEAVIEKDGKEWGYTFGPHGKWLGKHEEGMEKGATD